MEWGPTSGGTLGAAVLSADGRYRYQLGRAWDVPAEHAGQVPYVLWVMLNPSTADAAADDHTIRKCVGFTSRAGMYALRVVNLYAMRSRHPDRLRTSWYDPVGPRNDHEIADAAAGAAYVVLAWGSYPDLWTARGGADEWTPARERARVVAAALAHHSPLCIGTTKTGHPRHPLIPSYATRLVPYRPPGGAP